MTTSSLGFLFFLAGCGVGRSREEDASEGHRGGRCKHNLPVAHITQPLNVWHATQGHVIASTLFMPRLSHAAVAGMALALCVLTYVAVRKIGLAPHDVLLVCSVGIYAFFERWRGRGAESSGETAGLLGEDVAADGVTLRWWEFACEHHQLLGCVVRSKRQNRRSRSERILSLAVSSLALLYWRAIFRVRVRMQSLEGLKNSLWTLLVSKGIQQLMKQLIRVFAGRTARWQESAGWLDALQLQWHILQYWTLGFMMLVVFLALREGRAWVSLLMGWLTQMGFALVFFDLAFTCTRASHASPGPPAGDTCRPADSGSPPSPRARIVLVSRCEVQAT